MRRSRRDQFAAMDPGAGAEVQQIIRRKHGVHVVFNHNDRVADVAEFAESGEQTVVVTLMQSDAGFVENVKHADESAAELSRQTDSLCLAAGKGTRRPG